MIYYLIPTNVGLSLTKSLGDGYSVNLKWNVPYSTTDGYKVANNIYYSTDKDCVFYEGPKFAALSGDNATIVDLTPGQIYYFSVRPVEYNPTEVDFNILPIGNDNLKIYPKSLLRSNISSIDLVIPLLDIDGFPNSGLVKIGLELIQYSSIDTVNNNLILNSLSQRGYKDTPISLHTIDGYDGYNYYNPDVFYFIGKEDERFDRIFLCQSRFEYPNYAWTLIDGYRQVTKDILTTDLSGSDEYNKDFPSYDFSGWHRTDPSMLLSGACVGSYIGGERYCADGYSGVGRVVRGMSLQEMNNQRQEMLLDVTGEPVVLLKRQWTGIHCSCYLPSSENLDDRCPKCFGSKFVLAWEQYFNPRRSDGRIMVRFSPAEDDVKRLEAGLESEFSTEVWTLTVPTIKDRDVLIRFDQDGNEEFRYEVMSVTRNKTIAGLQGGQRMRVQRIRKTDRAYQIKAFKDTGTTPSKLSTSIGFATGIPPHTHDLTITNQPTSNFNQLTSVNYGHNHIVVYENGQLVVKDVLGHDHTIIF